jgi:chromosome segregation ATPase
VYAVGRRARAAGGQNARMSVPTASLDRLRELELRDAALLAEAGAIDGLMERTAAVRREAAENVSALAAVPAERAALEASQQQAAQRVAAAQRELDVARDALASAGNARRDREARVAEARGDVRAAEEGLLDAERHVERLADAVEELMLREERLQEEHRALTAQVEALVREVAGTHRVAAPQVGRVPDGLEQLDAWGVEARAALFVARGSVAAERERIVAEANAIGSAALGEDVGALGVAQVIRLLESA